MSWYSCVLYPLYSAASLAWINSFSLTKVHHYYTKHLPLLPWMEIITIQCLLYWNREENGFRIIYVYVCDVCINIICVYVDVCSGQFLISRTRAVHWPSSAYQPSANENVEWTFRSNVLWFLCVNRVGLLNSIFAFNRFCKNQLGIFLNTLNDDFPLKIDYYFLGSYVMTSLLNKNIQLSVKTYFVIVVSIVIVGITIISWNPRNILLVGSRNESRIPAGRPIKYYTIKYL